MKPEMSWSTLLAALALWMPHGLTLAPAAHAAEPDVAWRPLFNGRDLTGWINVNCAPNTFSVSNEMIVSTGVPTGILRSDRQYENFELELEYRHMKPRGNAGLFVWSDPITSPGVPFARSIEVQILDGRNTENATSHGDVFAIHGATFKPDRPHPGGWMRCLPSERRANPAGEWNHYRVLCSNGVVKLAVNGKVVSGGFESRPRNGYLCLESEGSECHFRNLRIRELPSTGAPPAETAPLAEDFRPLYTGVDLRGWKVELWHVGHWQARDWVLAYDGKAARNDMFFWTQREFGDFVFIADWRLPRKPAIKKVPLKLADGSEALNDDGSRKMVEMQDAGDSGIYIRGSKRAELNIWCWPAGSGELTNYRNDTNLPAATRLAVVPKVRADKPPGEWNRFVITVRGKRVTADLNSQRILENAELPDLPARGPIALQYHGDPIEFANLFIKELPAEPSGPSRVVLVAGGGSNTNTAGGLSPTEARLRSPFGVDFDREGNLFLVEMTGERVRKLGVDGVLSVVAGVGLRGAGGKDGPALSARFNGMHNLAIAPSGEIYLADTWNNQVRRFDPRSGTVGILAGTGEKGFAGDGGLALEAKFGGLYCASLDPAGERLLLADLDHRRVREVNLKSGTVRTVAGNGQKGVPSDGALATEAPLVDPRAVIADRVGNVYVLERGGHALRVVTPDGRIRTVAGTGRAGNTGDGGDARLATLNGPKHLCLDHDGSVLIADTENHVIRRFTPGDGRITRVAGRGVAGAGGLGGPPLDAEFRQPHGTYVHADGTLYISDSGNHRVVKVER